MLRLIALAIALLALTLAAAPPIQAAPRDDPRLSNENSVRIVEEQERWSVLKGDVAALERLWSEELIVNNPQNEISVDRGAVLDRVKRGLIRYSEFERRIESIRFNGDLAIVMGSETVVRKDDSATPRPAVHRRYTNIWKRSGSTWRLIVRHANVVAGS